MRSGVIIELSWGSAVGRGEAAPLPGWSRETVDEVIAVLQSVPLEALPFTAEEAPDIIGCPAIEALPFPSLRFGLESALLELTADRRSQSLARFLGCRDSVSLHALVAAGSADDLFAQARRRFEQGFSVQKIKIGGLSPQLAADALRAVAQELGESVRLRADANRRWSLKQALQFAEKAGPLPLDYIEEPVHTPQDLPRFQSLTGLPTAVDETLLDSPPPSGVAAYILKPGLHGGIGEVLRLARIAEQRGATPVLSCPFYSAVGLRTLVHLAAAYFPDTAMGLDTAELFAEDLKTPPTAHNGRFRIVDFEQRPDVQKAERIL